ncbi:MAG: anti-sigma factor antagonist [Planctomycetaceae bacterium]|nr:anti-sigma factor antagonist [Planctomycetaceae bacterium]
MPIDQGLLEVYEAGRLTVLGFGGRTVLEHINLSDCREEIAALIKENNCETLAFDLTGIRLLPSGLLGLLASLRQLGVEVHVYNPSEDVREVLEITRLERVMHVHELEL